ncbi:MAG: pilus assembly protein PilZ [Sphingomonas bacterium]|nr:PilZ domain-containing protein [Sphingomonas bacterium]MDB5690058.1 pilus assembly protein PilZ [Sphingomonas bacterium]
MFGRKLAEPVIRAAERSVVAIPASLRLPAGERIPTQIEDLSASGFRASIRGPINPGMLIRVSLPIGRSPKARVVWVDEDQIGCAFLAWLEPGDLSALLAD